ncbi:hypothetical protein BBF96_14675 [Anoxybacter fermentans]|uniref:SipL SPOCS domain-containing protein n=1 Tax=Anoxybacter fermentans TaxID=1323375 RepID=A0A3S9T1X6_9FIRM|nr:DUF3794 domain-containing protein [Anoxybacter fermentans]AZR74520.1 hypothetical protein BBF96_14675 [Anoxybacter fermentans]
MESIFVEELVNLRHYRFDLDFELPLNLSSFSYPELSAKVKKIRQFLRPEGLMVNGMIAEELTFTRDGIREMMDHIFHFTYLIPGSDLMEANLLNFEIDLSIEQIDYHLIKKKGQVFLKQKIQMKLIFAEYHVKDHYKLEGLKKKSGIFQKKKGELEKSFLRIYPIQLPEDFFLLSKITGVIDKKKSEITQDGCFIDITCLFWGEYVTDQQKLGTFFFEKKEHFFIPKSDDLKGISDEAWVLIDLDDLVMEEGELVVLYHCQIKFFQKKEVNYYTGESSILPEGVEMKVVEVEQIGQPVYSTQMLEESIDLSDFNIEQVVDITGEFIRLKIEKVKKQLFISGDLEYIITYLDKDGIKRNHKWSRLVEQMIINETFLEDQRGYWQVEAVVEIPDFNIRDKRLSIKAVIDYQGIYHYLFREPVLTRVEGMGEGIKWEKFYLTEEVDRDQIVFPREEKVYLYRYASQILKIESRIKDWQIRFTERGWIIRGEVELTIYYLSENSERHHCQTFYFYRYIPLKKFIPGIQIHLTPRIKIVDHELLEDGSLVRVCCLVYLNYFLYQRKEHELVTDLKIKTAEWFRPVLKMGSVEQRLEERILLGQIEEVQELELNLRDYEVNLNSGVLRLDGEVDVKIKEKERVKIVPVQLEIKEKITLKGKYYNKIKVFPVIKGYEYHSHNNGQLHLSILMELSYRLIGMVNFC